MPTTPRPAYPVSIWEEPPSRSLRFDQAYWAYDAGTNTWTVSTTLADRDGELVDVGTTGVYTLVAVGTSPTDPRLVGVSTGTVTVFR